MRSTLSRATRPRPADAEGHNKHRYRFVSTSRSLPPAPEIQMIVLDSRDFPSGDHAQAEKKAAMVAHGTRLCHSSRITSINWYSPLESENHASARRQVTTRFRRVHPNSGEIPIVALLAGTVKDVPTCLDTARTPVGESPGFRNHPATFFEFGRAHGKSPITSIARRRDVGLAIDEITKPACS